MLFLNYDISVLEFIGVSITSVWYLDRELNKELKKYKVEYADQTSDYLSYNDFDGAEVILAPNCRP